MFFKNFFFTYFSDFLLPHPNFFRNAKIFFYETVKLLFDNIISVQTCHMLSMICCD